MRHLTKSQIIRKEDGDGYPMSMDSPIATPANVFADAGHDHEWSGCGSWGVIIGAATCKTCGRVSETSDFPAHVAAHAVTTRGV